MPGVVPGIYRAPRGTPVRDGGGVGGRKEREREREGERERGRGREEGEMLPWPIHKQMNSLRL